MVQYAIYYLKLPTARQNFWNKEIREIVGWPPRAHPKFLRSVNLPLAPSTAYPAAPPASIQKNCNTTLPDRGQPVAASFRTRSIAAAPPLPTSGRITRVRPEARMKRRAAGKPSVQLGAFIASPGCATAEIPAHLPHRSEKILVDFGKRPVLPSSYFPALR